MLLPLNRESSRVTEIAYKHTIAFVPSLLGRVLGSSSSCALRTKELIRNQFDTKKTALVDLIFIHLSSAKVWLENELILSPLLSQT